MRRGTTPTITITTDVDLTPYGTVILTIRDSAGKQFDLSGEQLQITADKVQARLTQQQTLGMACGSIQLQLRAAKANGTAIASNIMNTLAEAILKDGEISGD